MQEIDILIPNLLTYHTHFFTPKLVLGSGFSANNRSMEIMSVGYCFFSFSSLHQLHGGKDRADGSSRLIIIYVFLANCSLFHRC